MPVDKGGVCLSLAHPERVRLAPPCACPGGPAGRPRAPPPGSGAAPDPPPPRGFPGLLHPFRSPGPPYPWGRDWTALLLCGHRDHTLAGPGSRSYPRRTRPASGWRLSPSSWLSLSAHETGKAYAGEAHLDAWAGTAAPGARGGAAPASSPRVALPALSPAWIPACPAPPGPARAPSSRSSRTLRSPVLGRPYTIGGPRPGTSLAHTQRPPRPEFRQSQSFLPATLHFLTPEKWKVKSERHISFPCQHYTYPKVTRSCTYTLRKVKFPFLGETFGNGSSEQSQIFLSTITWVRCWSSSSRVRH